MHDILIIGNGFDLYHKLPTRYIDFLFLTQHWNDFYNDYQKGIKNTTYISDAEQIAVNTDKYGKLTVEALKDFSDNAYIMNPDRIEKLGKIISDNVWIKYFIASEYEKEGWIDFEAEIENVLECIENFFNGGIQRAAGKILSTIMSPANFKTIKILNDCTKSLQVNLGINHDMEIRDLVYGETKTKLIKELESSLNELIEALDIYMEEFVGNIKPQVYSEQIKGLSDINLLNFNYTYTYKNVYGGTKLNKHHQIHGSLQEKDIVLGISDKGFDNLDYIYFQKYFQRIQKRTGSFYRDWIPKDFSSLEDAPINVYIMGHSLGETDKDVLSEFFHNKKGIKKITIFYHNQKAYEDLVIALIALYGKEFVIEETGNGRIDFVELKEAVEGSGKGSY